MALDQQTNGKTDQGHELRLVFPDNTYRTLEELARRSETSILQVLANAIALEKLVSDARRQGSRVLLEHRGRYEEITRG